MTPTLFKRTLTACKMALATSLVAIGLSACGGGGGANETVIAPESMDQVKIDFFKAFTMEFSRLSGTAGNETGGAAYTRLKENFRWEVPSSSGNSGLGRTIDLPLILSDVKYLYERTGYNTGRLTISFSNRQVYAAPATIGGDMFWGGGYGTAGLAKTDNLVVDLLFTDGNGSLGTTTARIRYAYLVPWDNPVDRMVMDSTDLTLAMISGGTVPVHYDPYASMTDKTPASAVWTTFQGRSVEFHTTGGVLHDPATLLRKIAFQSVGGNGSPLPGSNYAEESGVVIVDCPAESVVGVEGKYSYIRTGGDKAIFSVTYGTTQVVYNLDFDALDSGAYTEDVTGVVGKFIEDLYAPQP